MPPLIVSVPVHDGQLRTGSTRTSPPRWAPSENERPRRFERDRSSTHRRRARSGVSPLLALDLASRLPREMAVARNPGPRCVCSRLETCDERIWGRLRGPVIQRSGSPGWAPEMSRTLRALHVGIRSSMSARWARALLSAEINGREPMTVIATMSTMTPRTGRGRVADARRRREGAVATSASPSACPVEPSRCIAKGRHALAASQPCQQ